MKHKMFSNIIKNIIIPASCVLPDTSLLGSLVPAPLVAVMVTVITWYGLNPVIL